MSEVATLRIWLDDRHFDWENGRIVLQAFPPDEDLWEQFYDDTAKQMEPVFIDRKHPVLDVAFSSGMGEASCPRFIAEDAQRIYFPAQYDGATWCEIVWKDLSKYVNSGEAKAEPTPLPGGS